MARGIEGVGYIKEESERDRLRDDRERAKAALLARSREVVKLKKQARQSSQAQVAHDEKRIENFEIIESAELDRLSHLLDKLEKLRSGMQGSPLNEFKLKRISEKISAVQSNIARIKAMENETVQVEKQDLQRLRASLVDEIRIIEQLLKEIEEQSSREAESKAIRGNRISFRK